MDRPAASSFRDLEVYRLAVQQAGVVYETSLAFPRFDQFGLTDQIRRSSSAVPAIIAEAWPRRRYKGAFENALRIAAGEVCETQCWLDQAKIRGYISDVEHTKMNDAWEHVIAMLFSMIAKRGQFAGQDPRDR